MSVIIPVESTANFFDLQVSLEDVVYTLEFRWNVRASAWFMNILDAEGENMIRAGLRLVANFPLVPYTAVRVPPGVLALVDTSGANEDPGRDDLGVRHQLFYWTSTELGL